ncbi:hypothetical protein ACFFSY_32610 [Paenibacillus aurantiacus]|uniref:SbsA Ig-like domain-containing protein n=1 Tax=Paenibacillus aurantiacus TaxID=1936118 RepID=A0ABV5L2P1_9BACL
MGRVSASVASGAGRPAAIAGRMADERTLVLTFDRALAGASDALALSSENFKVNGRSGVVAEAYAEDREIFIVLSEIASGDRVDVSVEADTVFGAGIVAGAGNAAVNGYRIVTDSGALKLKNALDPDGGGFALADAVAYINRLKATSGGDANIAGLSPLDGADVRYLLSLLDLGLPDRKQLQTAIAQADALLAATQGRTDAERSRLSASREHAQAVAADAASTQRVIDEARVRIEASLAAFKPVGAKYRAVRTPLSVGLTPGSLLADGLFNEADRQKLGTDEGAAGASLRVVLPGADGGFDDYRPGDQIVLTVRENGKSGASEQNSYTYTLKASDVARMKKDGGTYSVDFDMASFLKAQGTDLAVFSYSALMRNGANLSQSSEAVSNAASEAFRIDFAPVIQTAPERVVQGEPIAVTVNDPKAKVYLTKRDMETDLPFVCDGVGGCSLATKAIEAGLYEIYAKDTSGQRSASRTVEVEAKKLPSAPAAPLSVTLSSMLPINEEGQYVFNGPTRDSWGWSEEPVMAQVELPGHRDAEPNYKLGDLIVIAFRGGERNFKTVVHALNSDEIGALDSAGAEETVTVSVDVTSYFLGEGLKDDTVEVAAHVQDAEDEALVSASVELDHTIWIDVTPPELEVSTGDVIEQPPAEVIPLDGGRIVAAGKERVAIYVIPWLCVEGARTEDQLEDLVQRGIGHKQLYTGSNVTFQASSLGVGDYVVLGVDEAGNVSVPESIISVQDIAADLDAPTLTVKTVESGGLDAAISLEEGRIWASSSETGTIYAVLEGELPETVTAANLDTMISREQGLKREFAEGHVLFGASDLGEGGYVLFAVDGAGNVSLPSPTIHIEDQLVPMVTVWTSEYGNTIPLNGGRIWANSTEAGTIFAIPAGEASAEMSLEALNALVSDEIGYSRPFVGENVVFEASDLDTGEFVFYAVDEALKVSAPSDPILIDEFYEPDLTAPTLEVTTSEDIEGEPAERIPLHTGRIYARSNESGMIYLVPAVEAAPDISVLELEAIVDGERGWKRQSSESSVTFEAKELVVGDYVLFAVDDSGNVSVASRPISIFYVEPPLLLSANAPDSIEIDDAMTIHLPIGLTAGDLRAYLQSADYFNIYEDDGYESSSVEDNALLTEENVVMVETGNDRFVFQLDFHPYVVKTAHHQADVPNSQTELTVNAPLMVSFNEELSEYAGSQVEEAFRHAANGRELSFNWGFDEDGYYVLTIGLEPLSEGEGEDPVVRFANNITAKLIEAESAQPETLLEVEPVGVQLSPDYEAGKITLTFSVGLSSRLLLTEALDPGMIETILVAESGQDRGSLYVQSVQHGEADNQLIVTFSDWDELAIENANLVTLQLKFKTRSVDTALGAWIGSDYFLYVPLA